jgi:protein ImuB
LLDTTGPAAVFEDRQGIRKILLANADAAAAGIGPGLAVNAALALLPGLHLEERDQVCEARVLRELAEWSEGFTSLIALEPPALLLLEIAGSLNLFGGIRKLRECIVRELDGQGFHASIAIAPTPLAATWLARAGRKVCIRDARNLVSKLGPLPLSCLDWPEALQASLRGMGITTIGEALRLPRQGFAKRFGAMRLVEFDRALGRLPDPRVSYRAPERFITDFDLNEEQSDATLLLNACRELLVRLERFLRRRQTAVQDIAFSFFHLRSPATRLNLGRVQADRAVQHWFDLLEICFERLDLPAPVIAIRLCGGHGQAFSPVTGDLPFRQANSARQYTPMAHLAERLNARMGDGAVHGVMAVAEHRPQYAWQARNSYDEVPNCAKAPAFAAEPHAPDLLAGVRRTNSLVLRRPLWVLDEPRLLKTERDRPCYRGVLKRVSGPERIETGWWDDDGIARDYFVAVNPHGAYLWVYRDRGRERHWYLHGMFG